MGCDKRTYDRARLRGSHIGPFELPPVAFVLLRSTARYDRHDPVGALKGL